MVGVPGKARSRAKKKRPATHLEDRGRCSGLRRQPRSARSSRICWSIVLAHVLRFLSQVEAICSPSDSFLSRLTLLWCLTLLRWRTLLRWLTLLQCLTLLWNLTLLPRLLLGCHNPSTSIMVDIGPLGFLASHVRSIRYDPRAYLHVWYQAASAVRSSNSSGVTASS